MTSFYEVPTLPVSSLFNWAEFKKKVFEENRQWKQISKELYFNLFCLYIHFFGKKNFTSTVHNETENMVLKQ